MEAGGFATFIRNTHLVRSLSHSNRSLQIQTLLHRLSIPRLADKMDERVLLLWPLAPRLVHILNRRRHQRRIHHRLALEAAKVSAKRAANHRRGERHARAAPARQQRGQSVR